MVEVSRFPLMYVHDRTPTGLRLRGMYRGYRVELSYHVDDDERRGRYFTIYPSATDSKGFRHEVYNRYRDNPTCPKLTYSGVWKWKKIVQIETMMEQTVRILSATVETVNRLIAEKTDEEVMVDSAIRDLINAGILSPAEIPPELRS